VTKKRQDWMRKSDVLFSQLVRDRDRVCQNCGSADNLQCAHLISRSYKSIRTDFHNAVALCRSCHLRFTHRPLEWREWVETRFPGQWDELKTLALEYRKVDWEYRYETLKKLSDSLGVS
jgi:5-methylcytosine-specific restriction endonuclease McrA